MTTAIRQRHMKISNGNGTFSAGAPQHFPFSQSGWWVQASETQLDLADGDAEKMALRISETCEVHIGIGTITDAEAFADGEFGGLQASDVTGYWGQRGEVVYAIYIGTILPQEDLAWLLHRGSPA